MLSQDSCGSKIRGFIVSSSGGNPLLMEVQLISLQVTSQESDFIVQFCPISQSIASVGVKNVVQERKSQYFLISPRVSLQGQSSEILSLQVSLGFCPNVSWTYSLLITQERSAEFTVQVIPEEEVLVDELLLDAEELLEVEDVLEFEDVLGGHAAPLGRLVLSHSPFMVGLLLPSQAVKFSNPVNSARVINLLIEVSSMGELGRRFAVIFILFNAYSRSSRRVALAHVAVGPHTLI